MNRSSQQRCERAPNLQGVPEPGGRLVLEVEFGGLGDSLFLSPIPRLYKEQHPGARVYVSTRSRFRSDATRRVVWEMNPFVDGWVDEPGRKPQLGRGRAGNILCQMATDVGVNADAWLEPEVYYRPALKPDFRGLTLVDLNYTSFIGGLSKSGVKQRLAAIGPKAFVNPPTWARAWGDAIATASLEEYMDAIHSCGTYVCLTSGGATLAAALRKPAVCFYGWGQNPIFHHSPLHTYVEVSSSFALARVGLAVLLRAKNIVRSRLAGSK